MMKKNKKLLLIAIMICGASAFGLYMCFSALQKFYHDVTLDAQIINWKLLYTYNFRSGKVPKEVQKLNGKMVKIAGYIVPLSDNYFVLNEFLFVPDAQSCIHVPPPPPNLIIWVKLERPIPAKEAPYPAWLTGVFQVETSRSRFGNSAYKMLGKKLEDFKGYP